MIYILYLSVFLLGLFVGSFLNCVIYRLEKKESFLKGKLREKIRFAALRGRSFCPACKHVLSWRDLIPVLSFFLLKGKCRYCSSKISWQYPLVEISTALMFFIIFKNSNSDFLLNNFREIDLVNILYYWIIVSIFIVVFVYDLKHFIIPDGTVIALITVSFLWHLFNFLSNNYSFQMLFSYFLSGFGAFLFFLFFYSVSRGKWMGFGDVKLAFAIGFFLGFPWIVIALFLSFLIGSIIGVIMIISQKKKIKSEIPFAPFLVVGTFLALFLGENMLTHYLMFLRIY